ncbi:MAG TPA: TonB-dependent receptor [Pyrinomonadaceae bacterium]|jgi:outer membrane receptor protein involved in Fe transport
MRNPIRLVTVMLTVALALCMAMSASAQTSTTGSIEGMVTDVNGAAVPGVTVTATSPNLIRPQTAVSDEEGRYRLSNLTPGRYTVTVESEKGFAKFEQADVEVNLSKTSSVMVSLRPAGATEVVNVTASSGAAVDVTTTTSGTNVSTEQFSNFPTQRTIQSLYNIAPSVTRSGLRDASGRERDPSVAGSSGPENNYILDGINTTDPAFGGGGANMPFEFVQEVEVKTGAYGAEYGHSTGGIFNVITKSGGNEFRGDVFGYFTTKGMVRDVKSTAIPQTGAAPSKFSEVDAGFDIGGPIVKNKLTFFAAFNPQRRTNEYLTQTFLIPVENKVTTPFYAGKISYDPSQKHRFTFSTFGDFTKQDGFLFRVNARVPDNGFGADINSFRGTIETGGQNYAARLNSTWSPTFIGEYSFGLHLQRANTIPEASVAGQSLIQDNFAIIRGGAVLPVVDTGVLDTGLPGAPQTGGNALTAISFVDGRGGSLVRNYTRAGFGLVSEQNRNRWELAARHQNFFGKHTLKYGAEFMENRFTMLTTSSGPARNFADPLGEEAGAAFPSTTMPGGVRITNRFGVCTASGATVTCPSATFTRRLQELIAAGQGPSGITTVTTDTGLTSAQLAVNPILVFSSARVRDFFLNTGGQPTKTRVESAYIQDDWKVTRNVQLNLGLRWDYQQAYGTESSYIKLNNFISNMAPRVGFVWDFTGTGRGKVFANFAKFIETPIPLDVNVRAGGDDIQLDRNINANRVNAPVGSVIIAGLASGLGCLGCEATPVDNEIKPQSVWEGRAGIEYEAVKDLTLGFSGIYRSMGWVIEDGSFDDGEHYFLFNPGRRGRGPGDITTEDKACNDPVIGCFGRARRYYRGLEFTATKRFTDNWQFISSYTYSSLIGNYEGLFRNDNGQSDPNITSLFDLPSLLGNTYGRLPNDRPHQFKFNGSYRTPFRLLVSGNYYIQSGQPFNALVPHPVYGDNEGFGVPRGTAINPITGSNRTPTTYQLDFGAHYPISLGENRELRFQFDWFNVTNVQRSLRDDETVRINSGIPGANGIQFFNPSYGTGLVFQFPSAMRLGAKFSF